MRESKLSGGASLKGKRESGALGEDAQNAGRRMEDEAGHVAGGRKAKIRLRRAVFRRPEVISRAKG